MRITIAVVILSGLIILQSTLGRSVAISGVKPDIALIALLFFANRGGKMPGQLGGFFSGLLTDVLSLAPLGFNALTRMVIGFLFSLSAGKIFVDPLLMPMVFTLAATLLKTIMQLFLAAVFLPNGTGGLDGMRIGIELAYNLVLSPIVFGLLGLLGSRIPSYRREFGS